jgi:hypothetical protein
LGGVASVKETKDGKTLKGSKGLLNPKGFKKKVGGNFVLGCFCK